MTPDEARTILNLPPTATSAERLEAHAKQKVELEQKLAKAPTDGLRAKYRDAITRLDQAIEVLELAGAGADLPALAPSSPAPSTGVAVAPAPTASASTGSALPSRPPVPKKPSSRVPMFVGLTAIAVIALGGLGAVVNHQSSRSASALALHERITVLPLDASSDDIRSVAGASADFPKGLFDDHQSSIRTAWQAKERTIGSRAAEISAQEKARAEADIKRAAMALDDRLTDAKRRMNALEQEKTAFEEVVRQAERQLSEVKSAEREATKAGGWQAGWTQQERISQERWLQWLTDQKVKHPAWLNLRNAADFLRDKKAEATEQEIAAAEASLLTLTQQQAAEVVALVHDPLWKHAAGAWMSGNDAVVTDYLARFPVSAAGQGELRSSLRYLDAKKEDVLSDAVRRLALLARVVGDQDADVVKWAGEQQRRERVAAALSTVAGWNNDASQVPATANTLLERLAQDVGVEDRRVMAARDLAARGVALAEEKRRAAEAEAERQRQIDAAFLAKYGTTRPRWASSVDTDQHGLWADLTVNGVTQRMRWIKPGEFMMGSLTDETDRQANEAQHTVRITRGFWLADSECTQGMWQGVMGGNPSNWQDASRPVEQVSWDDCQQFLTKLNVQARGLGARLPTEAEWEYACRAGTTTAFAFGVDITASQVNFDGNFPLLRGAAKSAYRQQTVSVKQFPANAWGLHDMHGNVWEWCSDWYTESLPLGVVSDPIGPASGSNRVFRGGGWIDSARSCRSAYRGRIGPGNRYDSLGFRLCAQSTP